MTEPSATDGQGMDDEGLRRAGTEAQIERLRLCTEATLDGIATTRPGRLMVWLLSRWNARRRRG